MVFHLQLVIFLINLVYTSLHEVVLQLKTSLLDFFSCVIHLSHFEFVSASLPLLFRGYRPSILML